MTDLEIKALQPGDRIYRWWDAGICMQNQPLTVMRVNRLTVTVKTDQDSQFYLPHEDIAGRVNWGEDGA